MAVHLGLGLNLRPPPSTLSKILAGIMRDPNVQIAGRDGSMSLANPGCTFLDPPTGQAISANRAYNLVGPCGLVLPMYTAFPAVTNLFLNSQAPATQDVNVVTGSVTVTAIGSGYTLETAANTATGSGFGVVTMGTAQVLTITGNGSITLTVTGTPVGACVQVQAGAFRTPLIVTTGASVTRAVDANVWTMADALTQDEEIIVLGEQDYASGDMGITTQTWMEGKTTPTAPRLYRHAATTLRCLDADTASSTANDDITRTLPAAGVLGMSRLRRIAASVAVGYGTTLSGSPTAIPGANPWYGQTEIYIGHSTTTDRAGHGRFSCIRRKGGFSQAQIDALYYAFANGRTVPVVA